MHLKGTLGCGLTERQKIALQLFFCMQLQVESCIQQKSCTRVAWLYLALLALYLAWLALRVWSRNYNSA
jgi:hypothetical protein